ncbi:MAG TPA: hypothetical protein VGN20_16055 [Mucilaginibacter sp.]
MPSKHPRNTTGNMTSTLTLVNGDHIFKAWSILTRLQYLGKNGRHDYRP